MSENILVWVCFIFTRSSNSQTSHWTSWDFYLSGITWFSTQLGLYSGEYPGKRGGKRSPGTAISLSLLILLNKTKHGASDQGVLGYGRGKIRGNVPVGFVRGCLNSVVGKSVKNFSATWADESNRGWSLWCESEETTCVSGAAGLYWERTGK